MEILLAFILILDLVRGAAIPDTDPDANAPEKVSYDGYKVLRIPYDTYAQNAEAVSAISETLSDGPATIGHVDILVAPDQINKIDDLNLDIQVLHEDLGADISQEETFSAYQAGAVDASWFNSYHTYADHLTFLNDLHTAHPSNTEIVSAGTSFEGRNITGIHFWGSSGKAKKPAVVLHSTVHAREWITTMANEYIAYQLLTGYATDSAIKSYVDAYDFYVFPFVNVDGFVYTQTTERLWRKNRQTISSSSCVGTDINRNWATGWSVSGGSSTNPCDEDYRGTAALSAPETKALSTQLNNVAKSQGLKLYIDWHSYSQLWMYPYGYSCSKYTANNAELSSLSAGAVAAIKAVNGKVFDYGPICSTIYQASGSSVDYVNDVSGADYTFTAELRDTGTYGFVLPAEQILPASKEIWAAVVYLLKNIK